MSRIEIGRWSEMLRRITGQKGSSFVATELAPEISPTFQLESNEAEWDFLKGVRGCAGADDLAGAVGFNSTFRLRNPEGSGVIGIVDALSVTPGATAGLNINRGLIFGDLAAPGVQTTVVPDFRWGQIGTTTTALVFSASNTVAAGPSGDRFAHTIRVTDVEWLYRQPVVLIPGTSMDWGGQNGTTNVTMRTWLRWRERALPPLER